MRFFRISRFLRRFFFANVLRFFGFLSLLLARSRRAVANLEERVKNFIDTALFWPVEVGEILMRLLIVKVSKLVWIITQRNWLVSKIAFGGSLGGVFLCYWFNFQLGRWSVGLSFFILHSSFLPVSGSKGKG